MKQESFEDPHDLDALRQLLVGPELEKIKELSEHLENAEQFSTDISDVLPRAMVKSAEQGGQLSEAMVPTVEEIVRLSIKRDINKFADALFPVIGPAIRKSISETIRQMLQSLNQMLESSFSKQGLKWRFESIRTGIPYAQIVLLHSFVYRVEQAFLIHRETGLLLRHVELDESLNQNADLVSSMLSAIGDFVGDSFEVENRQALDSIQVGDFSIWIEQSPDAILALAIRGDAPNSLRTDMQTTLEKIQKQYDQELSGFDGNTAVFELSGDLLTECMHLKYKSGVEKTSKRTGLVWLLVAILLLYWLVLSVVQSIQQNDYITRLENEPGYVITRVLSEGDELIIKGLRDPLSRKPEDLVALSTLNPEQVNHQLEPYQSLQTEFIHKRLIQLIDPPQNVSLEVSEGMFSVRGFASEQWIQSLTNRLALFSGITQINTSNLGSEIDLSALNMPDTVELSLDINTGQLTATGKAITSWAQETRAAVSGIKGILSYDDSRLVEMVDLSIFNAPDSIDITLNEGELIISGRAENEWIRSVVAGVENYAEIEKINIDQLVNTDEEQLIQNIQSLEKEIIFFDEATSFNFEVSKTFEKAAKLVKNVIASAKNLSRPVNIIVKGFSDSVGQYQDNVFLSLERADYVAQNLFITGISPKYITIKGIQEPVKKEKSIAEKKFNRRVTFKVVVD